MHPCALEPRAAQPVCSPPWAKRGFVSASPAVHVRSIRTTTKKVFADIKRVDVEIFGSFANGLSTWSSDVDLVVTGIMEPDRSTGGTYRHSTGSAGCTQPGWGEGVHACRSCQRHTLVRGAGMHAVELGSGGGKGPAGS